MSNGTLYCEEHGLPVVMYNAASVAMCKMCVREQNEKKPSGKTIRVQSFSESLRSMFANKNKKK